MRVLPLLAGAGLAVAGFDAAAQGSGTSGTGAFSLYFENDPFAGVDRNCTSGVKLSWNSSGPP
jgi:hypothetical protein